MCDGDDEEASETINGTVARGVEQTRNAEVKKEMKCGKANGM